jgi:group II intron reverse transcriptase/maturase
VHEDESNLHTVAEEQWIHSDSEITRKEIPWRERLAYKSRKLLQEKFNNLLHFLTPDLVKECLKEMPSRSAPGIDGMTVKQVKKNLDWLLSPALDSIHKGCYQAPPVKRVYIPKVNGKKRPIGMSTILDRSIQAGAAQILTEVYEPIFLDCSYGFRRNRSCHQALLALGNEICRGYANLCLEVDIRDFFGSLSHDWLKRFLRERISDERFLKLIDSWLAAGVMEEGIVTYSDSGTPQGGCVSPILANVYLHYVLDLWWEKKIYPKLKGQAKLIRYCDVFCILFESEDDAKEVLTLIKARFAQFGLTVADDKTHFTPIHKDLNGDSLSPAIKFLGFSVFLAKNPPGSFADRKVLYRTEAKRYTRAKQSVKALLLKIMHLPLKAQAGYINAVLRGHFNYYGLPGNFPKINTFRYHVVKTWRWTLGKRSQKGRVKWKEMNYILHQYPLAAANLKIKPWETRCYI